MRVSVTYDNDEKKIFDNVTEIKAELAFDFFENHIEIKQGKKKTKIRESEIYDFKVTE